MLTTRSGKSAAAMAMAWALAAAPSATAQGGELWGAATIVPGRAGVVEVTGYAGPPLAAGSALKLTAPERAEVTAVPLRARGYRGSVAVDGSSGTYTFMSMGASESWAGHGFPFVVAVPVDAVPGTRLAGCSLILRDASGVARDEGSCAVTVGLPAPVLVRPTPGGMQGGRPEMAGTAYPGAQVTVREEIEHGAGREDDAEVEVCSTTAAADGTWTCVPGPALPTGGHHLRATATLNGVHARSGRTDVTVP